MTAATARSPYNASVQRVVDLALAASAEAQHVAFRDGTRELPVRAAMETVVEGLSPNATLDDAGKAAAAIHGRLLETTGPGRRD